jgi:Flp pilus assembly protein TadG
MFREYRRSGESGVSLSELAIALPFVLMLIGGAINYGSMILQVQVMSEAVRHSARTAANRSNDGLTCAQISTIADDAFTNYVSSHTSNTSGLKSNWWDSPGICLRTRSWDVDTVEQFVHVSVTSSAADHCTFCFDRIWATRPIVVSSTFKLEWDCQGNGLPAC